MGELKKIVGSAKINIGIIFLTSTIILAFGISSAAATPFTIIGSTTVTADQSMVSSWTNGSVENAVIMMLNVTNGAGTDDNITSINITSKNSDDADVHYVKIWESDDTTFNPATDKQIDGNKTFLGGNAIFDINVTIPAGQSKYIFITYKTRSSTTCGNMLDAKIEANNIVMKNAGSNSGELDPAGNSQIDTTLPTVGISTAPGIYRGDISFNATANDICSAVDSVEFYKGAIGPGNLLSTDLTSPYSYLWQTTPADDGYYNLWVRAFDNAGNYQDVDTVAITVDNTEPNSTITTVVGIVNTSSFRVDGYANDTTTNIDNVQYQVDATGASNWANTNPTDGSFDSKNEPFWFNIGSLSEGSHTVYARATDEAGNVETTYASLSFCIDTIAPNANAGNGYVVDEGAAITLNASNSTDSGTCGALSYAWDLDNDGIYNDSSSAEVSYSWIDNGVFNVAVNVTDAAGNSDLSNATVTVNNVAPTITHSSNQIVNEGDIVSISSPFSDPGSNDTHTGTIEWGDGNTTNLGTVTTPMTHNHVYADNGVYTVIMNVTDDDSGMDNDSIVVTVNNVAPTVTVTSPNGGESLTGLNNITWTISDPGDDTYTSDVYISNDSGGNWTLLAGNLTVLYYEVNMSTYADGTTYRVNVTATDDDGGVGSDMSDADFDIDNTAPAVVINYPNHNWTKDVISVNHIETDAHLSSCAYRVNNGAWNYTITCNTLFAFNTTLCSDGTDTCVIEIMANDTNGLNASNTTTFSVDNSAPTITEVNVNDTFVIIGDAINITTNGTDPQGVKSCWAFFANATGSFGSKNMGIDCNGTIIVPNVADGNYTINVRVRNNVDTETWFNSTNITVDGTAPTISSAITGNSTSRNSSATNKIVVIFSEDLNESFVNASKFAVEGHNVSSASEVSTGVVEVTITDTMKTNETPNITIKANAVRDLAGNWNVNQIFNNTTDGLSPELQSASVIDTKTGYTEVHLTFSEPVNTSTLSISDFQIDSLTTATFAVLSPTMINITTNTGIGYSAEPNITLLSGESLTDGSPYNNVLNGKTSVVAKNNLTNTTNITIEVYYGWNFISVPRSISIADIANQVNYSLIQYYNPNSVTNWTQVSSGNITPLIGYWIFVTQISPANITISYTTPKSPAPSYLNRVLSADLQNMGATSINPENVSDALNSASYTSIIGWDNFKKQDITTSITTFEPGKGYWINVVSAFTLNSKLRIDAF